MKLKNKENNLLNGALFGVAIIGFAFSYIKARNVDKKVKSLGDHVNTNFNEFESIYNNFLEYHDAITDHMNLDLEDIKEEVGTCYEHIEILSKQLDKEDKVEEDCNEVI